MDLTPRLIPTDGHHLALYGHQAPSVVFAHGTPSWSHEFREVAARLEEKGTPWASLDHLGFGQSEKPVDGAYRLVDHQRRFAQAMEALDVRSAVFVLHDFGTAIALPWLLQHPDRVAGVVLANTFLWPVSGPMAWVARFYASRLGRWLYVQLNLSAKTLLPYAWGRRQPLTPARHAPYLAPFAETSARHATAALPAELVGETLATLQHQAASLNRWPLRAVWGLADPMVGQAELDRWRGLLPGLRVETLDDVGHFVCDEAPEAVVSAIEELLCHPTRLPASSSARSRPSSASSSAGSTPMAMRM